MFIYICLLQLSTELAKEMLVTLKHHCSFLGAHVIIFYIFAKLDTVMEFISPSMPITQLFLPVKLDDHTKCIALDFFCSLLWNTGRQIVSSSEIQMILRCWSAALLNIYRSFIKTQ